MFDIGFWELCLVGLVSLLVIGPERLPKAARIAGYWVGKTRSMVANVKAEIKEELHAEEMRQLLREQAPLDDIREVIDQGEGLVDDMKSTVDNIERHEKEKG